MKRLVFFHVLMSVCGTSFSQIPPIGITVSATITSENSDNVCVKTNLIQ